jgi:hypothetical protein
VLPRGGSGGWTDSKNPYCPRPCANFCRLAFLAARRDSGDAGRAARVDSDAVAGGATHRCGDSSASMRIKLIFVWSVIAAKPLSRRSVAVSVIAWPLTWFRAYGISVTYDRAPAPTARVYRHRGDILVDLAPAVESLHSARSAARSHLFRSSAHGQAPKAPSVPRQPGRSTCTGEFTQFVGLINFMARIEQACLR